MRKESYLCLLILFSVLLQGYAILSPKNSENSSDTLIRNKRVIDHSPGGFQPAHPTLSRHLVQILVADTFECAGSILQANIIITIRNCLYGGDDQYTVLSGSLIKNRGNRHRVSKSVKHHRLNIALLKIQPPITLSPQGSLKISLFTGTLPQNPVGLFSGWGCTNVSPTGERTYPNVLKAALLPIITFRECAHITETTQGFRPFPFHICTLDTHRERGACYGDEGGSLIYANHLVGIFTNVRSINLGFHPDIFMYLNHEEIAPWIADNTQHLRRGH